MRGLLAHLVMWDGLDFMGSFVWWVRYIEAPAVRYCSTNHPDEWTKAA